MDLPIMPPVPTMEARVQAQIPAGHGWQYEPKWDGFRALVFRDGDEVAITSRKELPLERYFPEVVEAVRGIGPRRVVLDGEVVIATPQGLDFEALQLRLHPAASRVARLAAETPASFVAFDLLAEDDGDLRPLPLATRRERLEALLAGAVPPVHVTPVTRERDLAERWFREFEGAGLDGVVAKRLEDPYRTGERAMIKVKHQRTADCVVAGFRWGQGKMEGLIGSLLLGLYRDGVLHHVGHTSSFSVEERRELLGTLAPHRGGEGFGGRVPGGPSRWRARADTSWEPLHPDLVCEVGFDHLQGDRFRHATRFLRWRPDKPADACTFDQLAAPVPYALREVFG